MSTKTITDWLTNKWIELAVVGALSYFGVQALDKLEDCVKAINTVTVAITEIRGDIANVRTDTQGTSSRIIDRVLRLEQDVVDLDNEIKELRRGR